MTLQHQGKQQTVRNKIVSAVLATFLAETFSNISTARCFLVLCVGLSRAESLVAFYAHGRSLNSATDSKTILNEAL